jgi:hypothetical protein
VTPSACFLKTRPRDNFETATGTAHFELTGITLSDCLDDEDETVFVACGTDSGDPACSVRARQRTRCARCAPGAHGDRREAQHRRDGRLYRAHRGRERDAPGIPHRRTQRGSIRRISSTVFARRKRAWRLRRRSSPRPKASSSASVFFWRGMSIPAPSSSARNRPWRPRAQLETAQSRLRLAEDQVTRTDLRVDAAGVVTAAVVEPGEVVQAGQMIREDRVSLAPAGS